MLFLFIQFGVQGKWLVLPLLFTHTHWKFKLWYNYGYQCMLQFYTSLNEYDLLPSWQTHEKATTYVLIISQSSQLIKTILMNLILYHFFLCAFPSYISGVHHFWVRFLHMWPFFNPTIKVVTFRHRGWCVLGVFLLPAFTRLGHERQDLLSPCDEMHMYTD